MSRVALVVGINAYSYLPALRAPAGDAEAVAQRLAQDGEFRVIRLPEIIKDSQPTVGVRTAVTRSELKRALVKLFKPGSQQSPDTALFYFSGHGVRDTLGISEGYLATSDANPADDSFGLSLRWLRRLLEESTIKQQVVWLDCCHSGELLNFGEADPGDRGKGRDRCFIAASRDFEAAYEDLSSPHSVLTQALLTGLNPQRYANRWVDNFLLADFINQSLKTEIQSPVCNNSGEPINLTRSWEIDPAPQAKSTTETVCPYKGLIFFDCNHDDPKYFYGRTALTDQLLDGVRQSNFLAIVGASGSGKSSVLRAGLLHQLKVGRRVSGSNQWDIRLLVPGEHPLQKLAEAFADSQDTIARASQIKDATHLLATGADGLRCLVQASAAERVILVVDQFEECFTLCQNLAERQQFFAGLLGALDMCSDKLCIVVAMRADFFGKCVEQDYSGLAKRVESNLVAVKAMSRDELAEAITKPAEQVGLAVEPELVQEILTDLAGAPGSLPLMQYALRELWQQRQGNELQLKTYSQLGGVMGTLKKRATTVYHGFDDKQQQATRHIFLSLTQLGEGTEDTRRRVIQQDLITPVYSETVIDTTVKALADANLVVTSEIAAKNSDSQRFAVVDVAHEALIRHWPLLRTWLDANRELIRRQRKIEVMADEWDDQKKKGDYLLRGAQLSDATDFLKKHGQKLPLSPKALNFIERGLKRRRNARLRLSSLLLIPILIFEILWREFSVEQHINKLSDRNPDNNLRALTALSKGCSEFRSVPRIRALPGEGYFFDRTLGHCRFLYQPNLSESDLSNVTLSYAYIQSGNFSFAALTDSDMNNGVFEQGNFIFSDLDSANFSNSQLRETYFRNANLADADFTSANLADADFRGADLANTNFGRAYLAHANFSNTNLEQANLSRAIYTHSTQFPEGFTTENLDAYLIAPGITLSDADLSEVTLNSAKLSGAQLTSVVFDQAGLVSSDFRASTLNDLSFTEANIYGSNFSTAKIINSSFTEAFLTASDFTNAHLEEVSFTDALLRGVDFRRATFVNVDLKDSDLSRADLRGANLESASLQNLKLKGAIY